MAPHARMAFCHVDQNALESFHVDLAKVPGVRNKKGLWVVPYNAVHTVNALVGKWGAEVSAAAWVVPPKPATTWEQVHAELAAKGEVRDWVINGFLTQYQKDSIVFGWPCLGNHFWHTTGAGKTLTGLITALSVPGPVVIVTRASSRIQYAREVDRFLNVRAYVVRPASHPGPLRVQGETYNEWRARHKGMYTRDEMKQAWESRKEQFGIDPTRGLVDYLRDCKGTRPFILVGWEALKSNLKELCSIQPGTVIFDESHRGKSTKRWDIEHLADLPADEEAAKKQALDEARRAKASDGFIKMTEEGRKMFTPVVNTASAAATLARAASHRICTTATPVKDRVRDLWAQLDLAEPNAWGSSTEWRKRHCLDPITPVLMGDGSYRSIGELSEGDEVIGWSSVEGKRFLHRTRVLATSRREAEIIQLRMVSGKVIRCTRDHHWLYSLAAKIRPYRPVCCWSETEQRWNRSLNHLLRVGPAPVGWAAQWTELPSGQGHVWWPKTAQDSAYATAGYKLGYIRGLIDGDGHQRINDNTYELKTDWGKARRRERKSKPKAYQMTIFQKEILPLTRACRYAQELSLRTTGVKPTADGQGYTLGFYSKEAYRRLSTTGWDSAAQSYKRGWLAGMYDAEGHAEVISQYEAVNPKNHRYLGNWLREFGFSVRSWSQGVAILGGKWELLRFFDLVRPVFTYKLDALFKRKPNFRFGKTEKDGIRSAFPLKGMHEVVSIQTETGNYIAAGYASKNCDMKPGVYGGMDDRGSSHVDELNQRLKGVAHILSYAETHMHLPPKRRQSVYIAPEEQTKPAAGFSQQFREAQKRGPASVLEAKLQQAASGKRKAVLSMVEDHVSSKQKVVIFTGRRRDCDELGELLRKQSYIRTNQVKVWAAHGDQSTQVRQAIVDDYMAHPGPCVFVGTGDAFGESLNIDDTDAAFFVMLPYTPGQLRQWEGRFHRASTKKPVIIYYVIAEGTIDEHVADILITKLPAVEAIAKDAELGEASDVLAGFDPNETPEQFAAAVLEGLDLWDT